MPYLPAFVAQHAMLWRRGQDGTLQTLTGNRMIKTAEAMESGAAKHTKGFALGDLPLLALLIIVPVFGGRMAGEMNVLGLLGVYAIFEMAFLGWLIRIVPKTIERNIVLTFALRVHLQAAIQVLTRIAAIMSCVFLLDILMAEPSSMDAAGNALWFSLIFLSKIVWMYAISVSWWRCLSLLRNGADFVELIDGRYKQKSVTFQSPSTAVSAALDKYLDRLKSPKTPRFSRMFYQANVRIESCESNGQQTHLISWALLPIRVRVYLAETTRTSTELHWCCELRGGIHRLELFPGPAMVLSVMRYLQTHLFQPLTGDLALSGAVLKQDELRHKALESQLRILQAQIEPHFLFNTLANVRHLYRSSVEEGEGMMDHLIVYLRSTLEELRSDVSTVSKEMDLVLHYLAIMKIRMGDRLSYSFINSDEVSARAFPPAMLISLVENAIKHGLNNKADGKLTISAAREEQHLRVTVLDNGAGFSSVQGTGVGLSNIRQRLEAIYGNRAWLEVGALHTGGFMASIVVPLPEIE